MFWTSCNILENLEFEQVARAKQVSLERKIQAPSIFADNCTVAPLAKLMLEQILFWIAHDLSDQNLRSSVKFKQPVLLLCFADRSSDQSCARVKGPVLGNFEKLFYVSISILFHFWTLLSIHWAFQINERVRKKPKKDKRNKRTYWIVLWPNFLFVLWIV